MAGDLTLPAELQAEIIAHCLRELPYEGCGLIGGNPSSGVVAAVFPTRNAAASSRLYTVEPKDHLLADRAAEAAGLSIIGVFHSHTHTDAYPSPTDVAQAPDPDWHYLLVSLRDELPSLRSYRITAGAIVEEVVRPA